MVEQSPPSRRTLPTQCGCAGTSGPGAVPGGDELRRAARHRLGESGYFRTTGCQCCGIASADSLRQRQRGFSIQGSSFGVTSEADQLLRGEIADFPLNGGHCRVSLRLIASWPVDAYFSISSRAESPRALASFSMVANRGDRCRRQFLIFGESHTIIAKRNVRLLFACNPKRPPATKENEGLGQKA